MHMQTLFKMLLKNHHPQGWWPIAGKYHPRDYSCPRNQQQREEIIIGAILTQNTSWKNVEKALNNLSKNRLLDIKKIHAISPAKLATLIRSAGYFNQKAERLKLVAKYIVDNYDGSVSQFLNHQPSFFSGEKKRNLLKKHIKKPIRELRLELLSLKGIGPETADSIILYAAEKPIFVIDAYTKRIFSRLGFSKKDYNSWQALFMENLPQKVELFKEYHALIVTLGKDYCKTSPLCEKCPLAEICPSRGLCRKCRKK